MAEDGDHDVVAELTGITWETLSFSVLGATLHLSETVKDEEPERRIHLTLMPDSRTKVRLPGKGEFLANSTWNLNLTERATFRNDNRGKAALGVLSFFGEGAQGSCHIDAALAPSRFSALLDALLVGRVPDYVSVDCDRTKGKFDSPDADAVEWDTEGYRHVLVRELRFRVPLIVREGDGPPRIAAHPAGRVLFGDFSESVRLCTNSIAAAIYQSAIALAVVLVVLWFMSR